MIEQVKAKTRTYNWMQKLQIAKNGLLELEGFIFDHNSLIGKGKFARVYKATRQRDNKLCAIRILKSEGQDMKKMLKKEVQILNSLNHENVIKLLERVKKTGGTWYFITEYCEQGDLKNILMKRQYEPFSEKQAYSIIRDLFQGLLYLSSKSIVHRDLKTANILMNNGRAIICDFGLAIQTKQLIKDFQAGTLYYMSPEGLLKNKYGPKTDVWAFGIIIYELLHGKNYYSKFQDRQRFQIKLQNNFKQQWIKKELSKEIKKIIMRCLQINVEKRYTMEQISQMPEMKMICNQAQPKLAKLVILDEININNNIQQKQKEKQKCKQVQILKVSNSHSNHKTSNLESLQIEKKNSQKVTKSLIRVPSNTLNSKILSAKINVKTLCTFHEYCCVLDRIIDQNKIVQYIPLLKQWLNVIAKTLNTFYSQNNILYDLFKQNDRQLTKVLLVEGSKFHKWLQICQKQQNPELNFSYMICKLEEILNKMSQRIEIDCTSPFLATGCYIAVVLFCTKLMNKCYNNEKYLQLQNFRHADRIASETKANLTEKRFKTQTNRLNDFY